MGSISTAFVVANHFFESWSTPVRQHLNYIPWHCLISSIFYIGGIKHGQQYQHKKVKPVSGVFGCLVAQGRALAGLVGTRHQRSSGRARHGLVAHACASSHVCLTSATRCIDKMLTVKSFLIFGHLISCISRVGQYTNLRSKQNVDLI